MAIVTIEYVAASPYW